MKIKPLKVTLLLSFIILLLLLSESAVASQTDNRGFPINQTPGSSFGTPPLNNPSPLGAPLINVPNNKNFQHFNNQQLKPSNGTKHKHFQKIHRHHQQQFFYFNPYGYPYPYYIYPSTYDNSYYYSIPYPNEGYGNDQGVDTDNDNDYDYGYSTGNSINTNSLLPDAASLPPGIWIKASNGEVPDKAFVYQSNNGITHYYCRAEYRYKTYYGVLIRNEGCVIQEQSKLLRLNQYEVLISY